MIFNTRFGLVCRRSIARSIVALLTIITFSIWLMACGVHKPQSSSNNTVVVASPEALRDNSPRIQSTQILTPTVDTFVQHAREEADHWREELQRDDIDAAWRQVLEERLAMAERRAMRLATARADPRDGAPIPGEAGWIPPPTVIPQPSPTPGIFVPPGGISQFSGQATIVNAWRGYADADALIVYAGAPLAEPHRGMIIVWKVLLPEGGVESSTHLTPTRSGSVRILAEQNGQLTLEAENGDLFVFDVATRQFVDDPPAPTPTVDPNATPTATEGAE